MPTIVLAGRGQTFPRYDWEGCPYDIGAVSGTILCMPVQPKHWFALDKPQCFAESFTMGDEYTQKNVPAWRERWKKDKYSGPKVYWPHKGNTTWPPSIRKHVPDHQSGWVDGGHENLRVWAHDYHTMEGGPDFSKDSDAPMVNGPRPASHSLIFAVQVVARLGYDRVLFAGCDLCDASIVDVGDVLNSWELLALKEGIQWINLSPESVLREWMTTIDAPDFDLEAGEDISGPWYCPARDGMTYTHFVTPEL